MANKISKIKLEGVTYLLRDNVSGYATINYVDEKVAAIKEFEVIICTDASNTPKGITWGSVTGTLEASEAKQRTFYMVPVSTGNNSYDEYLVVNNAWEKVGSTSIDLSNYYNKTEVDSLLEAKQDDVGLIIKDGLLCCRFSE